MNLELEFTLHKASDPFFTVRALILSEEKDVRFASVDKPDELLTAEEFKAKLNTVRFKKGPEFCIYVIKGRKGAARIPLQEWPVSPGYIIKMVRFSGTLKLK